jgi:bacterioferritin (cytochrome b1)
MTKNELICKLNEDLKNEYTHMHFYMHSAVMIRGMNRAELSEWLEEHAKGEFDHVQQFSKLIVGLGGVPTTEHHSFPSYTNPDSIMRHAYHLESQVVTNYAHRMEEIGNTLELIPEDKKYVLLFLEDQLLDSRGDLDEINQFF